MRISEKAIWGSVTSEVAGSIPVAPAINKNKGLHIICSPLFFAQFLTLPTLFPTSRAKSDYSSDTGWCLLCLLGDQASR